MSFEFYDDDFEIDSHYLNGFVLDNADAIMHYFDTDGIIIEGFWCRGKVYFRFVSQKYSMLDYFIIEADNSITTFYALGLSELAVQLESINDNWKASGIKDDSWFEEGF